MFQARIGRQKLPEHVNPQFFNWRPWDDHKLIHGRQDKTKLLRSSV